MQTIYQVIFSRDDEDGISTISSYSRYFSSLDKAKKEKTEWDERSWRNRSNLIILEVE